MRVANLLAPEPYRWRLRAALVKARSLIDGVRLVRRYPFLGDGYPARAADARAVLEGPYREYLAGVSSAGMAISLELACLLWVWLERARPGSVADLGSGFSSYVVRAFRERSGRSIRIVSVDDQARWLEKTRAYLHERKLPVDDLVSWEAFHAGRESFDCILHDLGTMALRLDTLGAVLERCAPLGALLLDDFHRPEYARPAAAVVRRAGHPLFYARGWTVDEFGRFAAIVAAPGPRGPVLRRVPVPV